MQRMHWFPCTYYSLGVLAVVLVTSSKIPQVLSDDTCNEKIQCKEGQLVLPEHMLKIRNNCTTELELTAENQTCTIHCMFDQMKLLDDSGKPSLTAYQAFANLEICASLSENARNCDCFRFAKKTTGSTDCEYTRKFDKCMSKFFGKLCKPSNE